MAFDYDYLIVGSGFGGSVSALRLAEKGWRVGVIEQGRRIGQDDRGYRFMRYLMGPMVDEPRPIRRAVKTLLSILSSPLLMARNLFMRDWEKRITVFTVMQDHDNSVGLSYRRRWWGLLSRGLVSRSRPGNELPSYMPIAHRATREYSRVSGGTPMSAWSSPVFVSYSSGEH